MKNVSVVTSLAQNVTGSITFALSFCHFLCPICSSRAARCTGWSLPGLTLNGDHLPVTSLGCFSALLLTERFLAFSLAYQEQQE